MRRDLGTLANSEFDLLVIGGGVVGASVARDATLRGLAVALVERNDFGSGASWNSLKTIHGGLRSLQHLDLVRMREYIRDRSAWLRTAPHLVHLLPVLVPAYGLGAQGRPALRVALALNDLISADRNRLLPLDRRLPPGRMLSRREALELVPELDGSAVTGGGLFHDGQMYASERLVLELLGAAAEAGAVVANYVRVDGPLRRVGDTMAVPAVDEIGGTSLTIRARSVVNASGSASRVVAMNLIGHPARSSGSYSVALNLMVPSLGHRVAFAASERSTGVGGRGASRRNLFVVPWRNRTIVGTAHFPYQGDPSSFAIEERHVGRFVEEARRVLPSRNLSRDRILLVHGGLLPSESANRGGEVTLLRRQAIVDHHAHGLPRLVSVSSVRFTTARGLAERVVNLVFQKLGRGTVHARTQTLPLPGAPADGSVPSLLEEARRKHGDLVSGEVLEHLVHTYGRRYERILAYRGKLPDWDRRVVPEAPVIRAQLRYAVEEEMAIRPEDLLYRRTEVGPRCLVTDAARTLAAEVLGSAQGEPAVAS